MSALLTGLLIALPAVLGACQGAADVTAVRQLVHRVAPRLADQFVLKLEPSDAEFFEYEALGDKILVRASSLTSLAAGAGWVLKYHAGMHFSWTGSREPTVSRIRLPEEEEEKKKQRIERVVPLSYYQNVCTVSYSMVWWDWQRWEQEIDWMALAGINFPLAFTGQEYVWQRLFEEFGVPGNVTAASFFSGPAFLAWQRMGNLQAWGGPLPQQWIDEEFQLQKKILRRMISLGMIPVLPAFAGHVPAELAEIYSNSSFAESPAWNRFEGAYGCVKLLSATDPLYKVLGSRFIALQNELYETDSWCAEKRYYNADTFNEMDPASTDATYLSSSSSAVYDALKAGDSKAVWVMQGWLFYNSRFWNEETISAYLSGVPDDGMIILDLYSDRASVWETTDFYYGKPFIWNMLHDFGGNLGMYGRLPFISSDPLEALNAANSTMVGMGMTPEGIFQNFIVYDLMSEMPWRSTSPDLDLWVKQFVSRRYDVPEEQLEFSSLLKAWRILQHGVYNCNIQSSMGVPKSMVVLRPSLASQVRPAFMPTTPCHQPEVVIAALAEFLKTPWELRSRYQILHDLVDVTRQALSDLFISAREKFSATYYSKVTVEELQASGDNLLSIVEDMEKILATHDDFQLGPWLRDARLKSADGTYSDLYEFNARNQITLWGPEGQITDYASKQWAGLVGDYYLQRWQLFVQEVVNASVSGVSFDQTEFAAKVFEEIELPWQTQTNAYPIEGVGNSFVVAKQIFQRHFAEKVSVQ